MWRFTSATFYGDKDDPKEGDSVVILISNTENNMVVASKTYTFTYDGIKGRNHFITNAKNEIKATCAALNKVVVGIDATSIFVPE